MDQTIWDESSAESSFEWTSFSKEVRNFNNICKKNIRTLKDKEDEILDAELLNPKLKTYDSFQLTVKDFLEKKEGVENIAKEHQAVMRDIYNTEQKLLQDIDNLGKKIKECDEELCKYTEEKKELHKEQKTKQHLVQKVLDYYDLHFDMKVDIENEDEVSFIACIYFSRTKNVKPVKISVSKADQKICLLEAGHLNSYQISKVQECLADEKLITPTFSVLRDIILDED